MCTAELGAWRRKPIPAHFPYEPVMERFHAVGKHFIDREVTDCLADIRRELPASSGRWSDIRLLRAFLDTCLDKPDGVYDYQSYLALGVLDLPRADDPIDEAPYARARVDRVITQLVADAMAFELAGSAGRTLRFPQMRPEPTAVEKRCKHGLRAILPALERMNFADAITSGDPLDQASQVVSLVRNEASVEERCRIDVSILPVYTYHDEYLFLRVLQAFESTFSLVVTQLRLVIDALATRQDADARRYLSAATEALLESSPLFSMLATMQIESFRTFRDFTEGASAIQSRSYKTLESICRTPDQDRIDSPAFTSVPEVRQRVLDGRWTLDDAFREIVASGELADESALRSALDTFSNALLRWRNTHYSVAVRMLGESTGTGYTEGTPYLDSVRDIPVFEVLEREDIEA